MQSWAARELKGVNLGDKRLNQRLVKIVEALCEHPEMSIPQAGGSWAATKAAYNFFAERAGESPRNSRSPSAPMARGSSIRRGGTSDSRHQ